MKNWTSLAAFMLILLFAGAADGIMDALGPGWFFALGAAIMGGAWALVKVSLGGHFDIGRTFRRIRKIKTFDKRQNV